MLQIFKQMKNCEIITVYFIGINHMVSLEKHLESQRTPATQLS